MYSTCLFCHSSLGANESIEQFPVGRRLAYDGAAGRLWVVCRSCERWNLSPLETRWEAIEEAERQFRGTKMRASTDNIGLARLKEGTELVRIGKPLPSEFAAWRYGDQFGKRYRKQWTMAGVSIAASLTAAGMASFGRAEGFNATMLGLSLPTIAIGLNLGGTIWRSVDGWKRHHGVAAVVHDDDGKPIRLTAKEVAESTLVPSGKGAMWKLKVPRNRREKSGPVPSLVGLKEHSVYANDRAYLSGDAALRALTSMLPVANRHGASKRTVKGAVSIIEESANVQALVQQAATELKARREEYYMGEAESVIGRLPGEMRFALEMSLHSDDERRAMEGELLELERRWREADEIGKIADGLLVPESVEQKMNSLREPL